MKSKDNKDTGGQEKAAQQKNSSSVNGEKNPVPYKTGKRKGNRVFDMVKDRPLGLIPYYKKHRVEEDW